MAALIAFLTAYKQYLLPVLGAVALIVGLHVYGEHRYEAGKAEVTAKWKADIAARDKASAVQAEQVRIQTAAVAANNVKVEHDYQVQIAAIAADRDSLARRLRDYDQVHSSPVPEAAGDPIAAPASAQPAGASPVDAAFDAYDKSCQSDAAQLNALIAELEAQQ